MPPGPLDRPTSPLRQSGAGGQRSLFPSGPAFTLETFSSRDFIVKDFIDSLSDSAAPSNRRSGQAATGGSSATGPFDPRPLIRRFEHAQDQLRELSSDLEGRETELSGAVRRAEVQHDNTVKNLSRKLDESVATFRRLDVSLNGHGTRTGEHGALKAVGIGERLEELDRQRTRAHDAKFLIQCWLEVSDRGELFMLEDMRRNSSGTQKIRCAQIAKQLLKISQRLDPDAWADSSNGGSNNVNGRAKLNGINGNGTNGLHHHQQQQQPPQQQLNGGDADEKPKFNTREIVEKFAEALERDLLEQFDQAYRRANFDAMRECATVLQDFGGGASVIASFVNQHQFFIDRSQLISEDVSAEPELWEALTDPDADSPGVEPSLQTLVDEVKSTVIAESSIIKQSFPFYEIVLGRFILRVFQQSIQQRLELVLEKAQSISTLAFLRSLQAARGYISAFLDELKSHGLTEHPEPLSTATALLLDQQFEDLFNPYFSGSAYIEREKRNLEELYSSLIFKFTAYHSRKRKAPTGYLASLASSGRDMLASAREAYVERLGSSDLAPQQKARMMRLAGLKDNDNTRQQAEQDLDDADGLVSTDVAKRMLKWLAEAVGRTLELSGGHETAKDVSALLDLLLLHMGQLYLETALDAASDAAVGQEKSKTEPDLSYLENLHASTTTMHLMLSCISTVLIPLSASSMSTRREMEKTTNASMQRLEEKVNSLMQRTIDIVLAYFTRTLSNQPRADFRPKDDNIIDSDQTQTCVSICTFLSRVHKFSLLALSPSPNLRGFLLELALQLRPILLAHFTKYQVSAVGGIMVQKDISKYREQLQSWDLGSTFLPTLETLTEVGTLFVVTPEALRERLKGKPVGERNDLKAYILKREDVGSIGVQSVLNAI